MCRAGDCDRRGVIQETRWAEVTDQTLQFAGSNPAVGIEEMVNEMELKRNQDQYEYVLNSRRFWNAINDHFGFAYPDSRAIAVAAFLLWFVSEENDGKGN